MKAANFEELRNLKALSAYRARLAAADRLVRIYYLLPLALNPALVLPGIRAVWPRLYPRIFVLYFSVWFVVFVACGAYAYYRGIRYLRENPSPPDGHSGSEAGGVAPDEGGGRCRSI